MNSIQQICNLKNENTYDPCFLFLNSDLCWLNTFPSFLLSHLQNLFHRLDEDRVVSNHHLKTDDIDDDGDEFSDDDFTEVSSIASDIGYESELENDLKDLSVALRLASIEVKDTDLFLQKYHGTIDLDDDSDSILSDDTDDFTEVSSLGSDIGLITDLDDDMKELSLALHRAQFEINDAIRLIRQYPDCIEDECDIILCSTIS